MCIVPKRCNDMMNVGRLQGFDVSFCVPKSVQDYEHARLIPILLLVKA